MKNKSLGLLTVYCGPMFAKKTSALLAEASILNEDETLELEIYKPAIDKRYDPSDIKTHDGLSMKELTGIMATPVDISHDFSKIRCDMIIIDEIQFFTEESFNTILVALENGVDVAVAGLDLDSNGKPFGIMPLVLSYANIVEKFCSYCAVCNKRASRTYRKVKSEEQVLVGGSDLYEPRCLKHWREGQ